MNIVRNSKITDQVTTAEMHANAEDVEVKIPKLKKHTFETAIIEYYRRQEMPVEVAMVERYLVGVSVCRVEIVTEALWVTRVSSSTVYKLNQKFCWRSALSVHRSNVGSLWRRQ